jgi:hypothetical protein
LFSSSVAFLAREPRRAEPRRSAERVHFEPESSPSAGIPVASNTAIALASAISRYDAPSSGGSFTSG